MATTSAAGLALRRHVIPLVSLYNNKAEGLQVSLSHYINLGDGTKEKRRDQWDTLTDGLNETIANFTIACNNLIAELVCPTDLADQ